MPMSCGLRHATAALLLALGLATLPASPAWAQAGAPPDATPVHSVEGIHEHRLANGLRVILYPDASKPTVTVNITYLVGSRHENHGETGMAHLLERLIFKGSPRHPNPDAEFTRRGFRNNGTTGFDRTNYFSTFQASDDNLRWALDWSADAMVNAFISRKDLDSEMTVVRNEFEAGESAPGQVLFKRLFGMMFDAHAYARLPIGNRSDIENVRIENLQAFYRTYYQPDNAVLTVAGRFDEARTLGWIRETFGRIPRPARELPPQWTVEPVQDGERSVVARRAGDVQLVALAYRIPSALSREAAALSAAVQVLGNTPNGRLHRALVEKGLAAQVFAQPMWLRDPGLVVFGAVVPRDKPVEPVRAALVEVVEGLAAQPPTPAEMARHRQEAETSYERALADPQQFGIALSEYIALGDWRLFFVYRDQDLSVGAEAAAQAAGRFFRRDNRGVAMFVPESQPQRAEIPAPLSAAEMLKGFVPRAAASAGEAFDPTPENIDRRTRVVRIGELDLALLPTATRGQTVNVAMTFHFGDEQGLRNRTLVPQLTVAMLSRGTSRLTRQQIADEYSRLKVQGGLTAFETTRTHLAEALKLTLHLMRDATFPQAEFEQLRQEVLASLQAQQSDPGARAGEALAAHLDTYPKGDPRGHLTLAESIAAVTSMQRQQLVDFHREFWGTARGQVAIVGDHDDRGIEALLRELFPTFVSRAPYARIVAEHRPVAPARLVTPVPDKENAVYEARLPLAVGERDADAMALHLGNQILGGGSGLSNRLVTRLRQREGLSYGVGSSMDLAMHGRASSLGIGAIGAPQNMARIEAAIREELQRTVREGFTQQELDDTRNGMLQERATARADDSWVAGAWTRFLDTGRRFAANREREERLRAMTLDELNATWRRHIDPARLSVSLAGDPAKGLR